MCRLADGFRGSGSCQSTRYMILYENRVKPTPSTATHLSGVYKLPEPNPTPVSGRYPETVVVGGIS